MLVAVKGNRETKIDENEKQAFIDKGFKIIEIDAEGKQDVIYDPTVVVEVDEKLVKEVEELKVELADKDSVIETLTKENTDLVKNVKEVQDELKKVAKELADTKKAK